MKLLCSWALAPALLLVTGSLDRDPVTTASGSFRCKLNGQPVAGTVDAASCLLMGDALSLAGKAGKASIMVTIYPATFAKLPQTRPVLTTPDTYVVVNYYPNGIVMGQDYVTARGGNVTITSYDAATRRASCTLTGCTAQPTKGPAVTITDAVFDNVAFNKIGR
ncbi:hypothetical protein [Hymenobacter metallicola]|uniref:Uncharacterized protein n=1 Tax=Hymenobacter metallicola TaxID=2563114 RepID=A0A4Z0PUA8_9BACT|nr:hypothetical protein [Hymenobacter metallicola]TGE20869.1 hypothetical protein E5K02_25030 [Hymenobacter metallicola]